MRPARLPIEREEACACPRPLPSGRFYFGNEACRLCRSFIPSLYHVSRFKWRVR